MFCRAVPILVEGVLSAATKQCPCHVPISQPKGFEILVVDDEPEIRELLAEHLRARGYRVATASDGLAAVSLIKRSAGQFGLILTDLHLPGAGRPRRSAGGARREPVDTGRDYHRIRLPRLGDHGRPSWGL